jgi:hypothetical protein
MALVKKTVVLGPELPVRMFASQSFLASFSSSGTLLQYTITLAAAVH